MKWFWWYFLIILAVLTAGRVYLTNSFPYTHDGENHLARFANYKIALKEGQLPPRFAPNLQNHYGYPVFNYNYPLANILSLPFSFLKLNYETTFKLLAISALGLLAVSTANWLATLGFSKKGQVAAVLALLSSPVVLNMTFYRGNIGELFGLALTVALLALIERSRQTATHWTWLVATWTALLLSHNITAVFATVFLVIYSVCRIKKIDSKSSLLRFHVLSLIGGVLLSLWFWLPALAEKNLIVLGQAGSVKLYADHFATLSQLLFAPMEFGFSYPGRIDTLSFGVGLPFVIAWVICTSALLRVGWNKLFSSPSQEIILPTWLPLVWLGSTSTLWLATHSSSFLWQMLPPLQYAQFPWRFELFAVIGLASMVGWVVSTQFIHRSVRFLVGLLIIMQLWQASLIKPADYFHRTIVDYDAFSQTTSTQNENRTKAFNYSDISDWEPGAHISSGNGIITTATWNGTERFYTVQADTVVTIIEPTMLFAGWQTTANGQKTTYIDSDSIAGRLAFQLDPGTYQIHSRFTQLTPARIIGNSVSLVVLLLMVTELLLQSKKWFGDKPPKSA